MLCFNVKPERRAHPAVQGLQLQQLNISPNSDIPNERAARVLGNACELVLHVLQLISPRRVVALQCRRQSCCCWLKARPCHLAYGLHTLVSGWSGATPDRTSPKGVGS
jgi:hypothetical protein